ncbi:MAG TPA: DinB family protein [Anaerolineales bacterium]|nr:DinB family protein [Anaerolineales bacterium]
MLNFTPVREKRITLIDLAADLTKQDLLDLTISMVATQQELIANCSDADVVFVPEDPSADDPFAERLEDVSLAWTLGHVIVHVTASSEEAAAIAAELARGVSYHGRSRYETDWQSVTTIKQCQDRLAESQEIRLASLEMWPDPPHLDNQYKSRPGAPAMNATSRFIYGLMHDDDHLEQISKIIQQAHTAHD